MPKEAKSTADPVQRVVTATLILDGSPAANSVDPTAEINGLVEAAGGTVVESCFQKRPSMHPKWAFGKGKIEELGEICKAQNAELLVIDCDLSPAHGRNIEKALDIRVIDRSELILDIFATRANTKQAKLQVDLAQMEYLRPRLTRMWTHLERTEGAIGTRGPGETQLETDRRLIDHRIVDLRRKLKQIEGRSHRQAQRDDVLSLSLVGYTNAGKSSLMSKLTGADIYIADQLFATLDTRVRRWTLSDGRAVVLSDTVGFVRDLPHNLVASFHATLEETISSDLLLQVVDASDPDLQIQLDSVDSVLKDIKVDQIPKFLIMNKVDCLSQDELTSLKAKFPDSIPISVTAGIGIEEFENKIVELLDQWSLKLELCVPASAGKLQSELRANVAILSEEYEGDNWLIEVKLLPRHWNVLRPQLENAGGSWKGL